MGTSDHDLFPPLRVRLHSDQFSRREAALRAYHSTEGPGLAYAIPYIDEITLVPTQRLLKLEFGFSTPQSTNQFQGDPATGGYRDDVTGDLNTALVAWVVQYRIEDPKEYLFDVRKP